MMKHKKLIMISPEQLERLRTGGGLSKDEERLSRLDQEMNRILKQSNLDTDSKWSLYRQVLDEYLTLSRKMQDPISIPLMSQKEEEQNHKKPEDRRRSLLHEPTLFSGTASFFPPPPSVKAEERDENQKPDASVFSPIQHRLRSAKRKKRKPEPYERILKWTKLPR